MNHRHFKKSLKGFEFSAFRPSRPRRIVIFMRLIEAHLLTYLCTCTEIAIGKAETDPQRACTLRRASYIVSSAGIVVSCVVTGICLLVVYVGLR